MEGSAGEAGHPWRVAHVSLRGHPLRVENIELGGHPWRVVQVRLGRDPGKRDDDPKIPPKNPLEEC